MNTATIHCPHCRFKQTVASRNSEDVVRIVCTDCGLSFNVKWLAHGVVVLPEDITSNQGE